MTADAERIVKSRVNVEVLRWFHFAILEFGTWANLLGAISYCNEDTLPDTKVKSINQAFEYWSSFPERSRFDLSVIVDHAEVIALLAGVARREQLVPVWCIPSPQLTWALLECRKAKQEAAPDRQLASA